MDGYKFDLRVYVLVLSCDPLKIFMYKNGLVSFFLSTHIKETERGLIDNLFMTIRIHDLFMLCCACITVNEFVPDSFTVAPTTSISKFSDRARRKGIGGKATFYVI